MLQKTLFTENDLQLFKALKYDPELKPGFEAMKACLIWTDELADGLTPDGYDKLCSLWIARSLLHQGKTFSEHPINPEYCEQIWNLANQEIPDWPGFKRVKLDERDRKYYEEMLNQENPFD